jgi:hypothetical protein
VTDTPETAEWEPDEPDTATDTPAGSNVSVLLSGRSTVKSLNSRSRTATGAPKPGGLV